MNKVHGGEIKSAEGIGSLSLDHFCKVNAIERVDLIKIDTDGHEMEVLKGATETIKRLRPAIIFEAGLYVIEGNKQEFRDYCRFFDALGYRLLNSSNLKEIDGENYRKHVPEKGTIDILAVAERS